MQRNLSSEPQHDQGIHAFTCDGYYEMPTLLANKDTDKLLQAIQATRPSDESLFLSEEEWNAGSKSHARTTPGPGYNLTEKLVDELAYVTSNSTINTILTELLGENYQWFSQKVVCRLPYPALPSWLQKKLVNRPGNTLNAFVKPPYRDVVYFLDTLLHQDNLEWARLPKDRKEHRLITVYVDLWNEQSPLQLPPVYLPGSHVFGATPYPQNISCLPNSAQWEYHIDTPKKSVVLPRKFINTQKGGVALWHSCLVHGAWRMKTTTTPHMVLVFKAMPATSTKCLLDKINNSINGPLYLTSDYSGPSRINTEGFWDFPDNSFFNAGQQL